MNGIEASRIGPVPALEIVDIGPIAVYQKSLGQIGECLIARYHLAIHSALHEMMRQKRPRIVEAGGARALQC